jgi:deazaflavin-dependent oxidoreductase (nitroreductase family)
MSRSDPLQVGNPLPTAGATTLRLQKLVNVLIRGLLRAPLLSVVVGKRLITLYVVGRRTGRHYAVPVAYTRHDGSLLVASQFAWARNLRSGDPVEIRLGGRRRSADVRVVSDEAGVVESLGLMARDNHQFAKFNKIGFDGEGDPRAGDLHLAWDSGTRVALLTPR